MLCWFGVLVGCPLIYVFVLSFMSRGPTRNVVFRFTVDNYMRIFDPLYLRIFGVSLAVAVLTSLVTLLIGYPFAYFTAKLNKRLRLIVLLLVMIPFWTSSLLRTYGWMIILQTEGGVLNNVLQFLGLTQTSIRFMYNYGAVLTVTVYMLLPFMILPIYNSVDRLDPSMLEASRDLGARRFETFWRVTLPMTMPGIIGGVTLVFVPAVGMFFISDLIGGGQTTLAGMAIYEQAIKLGDLPAASALSVVMMFVVLLFIGLYARVSKNTEGGLF